MQRMYQVSHVQLAFEQVSETEDCGDGALRSAVDALANQEVSEANGAVYTRREVVDFILDLSGYTSDIDLCSKRLLEPSFGHGEFLVASALRLVRAWKAKCLSARIVEDLGSSIVAVELHRKSFAEGRRRLVASLESEGVGRDDANGLADAWLVQGDFLLETIDGEFDFVVGNPPYVRQELIPSVLISEYRRRYETIFDRADLYIPFIERSLSLLSSTGKLGFICADRWMKNRYGGPLRRIIADRFNLDAYVDMTDTRAFASDVIAYPAITVVSRTKASSTRITHRPVVERDVLNKLVRQMRSPEIDKCSTVREVSGVAKGDEPWLLELPDQMALIRRLERDFPSIESVGCRIGIGVATGADKAFIGKFEDLDVEDSRKLPLATTRDVVSGEVKWLGLGVINPYGEDGKLVNLADFPKLAAYLEIHRAIIERRHCAQKNPENWYRTIDRIHSSLAAKQKLLIPDIKGEAHVVFEDGRLYPHHNLYYVVSSGWDLRALQAVLLSEVTRLFITTYSTKMRGGYLRFQAQYLRRLRLPRWNDVSETLRVSLKRAGESRDIDGCNSATFELYGLMPEERLALGKNGA